MRQTLALPALACLLLISSLPAHADEKIEQAIEARHGFYNMLAINMATLAGMAKGEIAYDADAAGAAASNIETLTKYDLPGLFVEGSASNEVEDSAAKPDIWTNMDDFREKFSGLAESAAGSAEAVKGGQEAVGPVVGKLGGACKACHDTYREKS